MKIGFRKLDFWFFSDHTDSLKNELLLFDKLFYETGPLNLLEILVSPFSHGKDLLAKKLAEIELFEKKGLIERVDRTKISIPFHLLSEKEITLAQTTSEAVFKLQGIGARNKGKDLKEAYSEFMELDRNAGQLSSRFTASILNRVDKANEYTPIIYNLEDTKNQDFKVSKQDVIHLILKQFPVISDEISIEQIIEFKSDKDIKLRYFELRDFITTLSKSNLSPKEIEDKIEYLLLKYNQGLELHKLKYSSSILETICVTSSEIIENLLKLKFSTAIKTLFELNKKNIEVIETENNIEGHELSYLVKIQENL